MRLHDSLWRLIRCCSGSRGVLAALMLLVVALSDRAGAQSIWELTPYRIQTWIVTRDHPLIPPPNDRRLGQEIHSLAEASLGAVWEMSIDAAPPTHRTSLVHKQTFDAEQTLLASSPLAQFDKLFVVIIDVAGHGYRLSVCELDIQTRTWSPFVDRHVANWAAVSSTAFDAMCDVFAPIVRIRRVEDDQVTVLVKAGSLLRPHDSIRRWHIPIQIAPGDVLQPYIRRLDRNGQVGPGGVKPIQWTLLVVREQDAAGLQCQTYSGYRQPFNVRRSSRVQQLALLVSKRFPATTLRLRNRRNEQEPLVGYDIYARRPGGDTSQFVGRTDWRGELVVPPGEDPVRILYVKSGQQLLAKLPVFPGAAQQLAAPLRNDDRRLEAEGFLMGIQESLVDLVARREVLTNRIRHRIADGKLDDAEALLKELRGLDTQEDFRRRVERRKQSLTVMDSDVQQKIDKLFADTRSLLGRFLDSERVRQLQSELDEARRSQG